MSTQEFKAANSHQTKKDEKENKTKETIVSYGWQNNTAEPAIPL